jgi:hypothetical protein
MKDPLTRTERAIVAVIAFCLTMAALFFIAGCPRPIPPPVPPADVDAGVATCETACARLQAMGCRSGDPTPRGAPCVEVCRNTEESGLVSWGVECVTRAMSCSSADTCAR